jgi:uncharacterized protein YdeI (BOF family)
LQGQITRQIGDDKSLFTDSGGMIVLEIDDVPASAIPLTKCSTIGEVEIDIKGIQLIRNGGGLNAARI